MRRSYTIGLVALVMALSLTGCKSTLDENISNGSVIDGIEQETGNQVENEEEEETVQLEYSNLVDEATQNEVYKILLQVGIKKDSVDTLLNWVKEFNSRVGSPAAFQEGFQINNGSPVNYDDVPWNEEYLEDGSLQMDMNCRITAYLLYQNFVTVQQEIKDYDPYLMFDVEAINTDPRLITIKETMDKFITLFQPVDIEEGSNLESHVKAIQSAWEERGIQLQNEAQISLITLYLHSDFDNKRFVGHAGVLVELEDGLLFVEKYGPDLPYQCTKFTSDEELAKYLLSRKDIYGDGTEELPIVMKNGEMIQVK